MIQEEQKSRLQKLKILAERGSPGERDNAKLLLEKLCNKYNVSLDQIESSEKIELRWFRHKSGKLHMTLLNQCIYKVLNREFTGYQRSRGSKKTSEIGVECTAPEGIEIELDYAFYAKHFEKETNRLLDMFIQKNNIFRTGGKVSDSKESKVTEEDILMYQSIKKQTRTLQIEGDKK